MALRPVITDIDLQQRGCKSSCGYDQAACHVKRLENVNVELGSVSAKKISISPWQALFNEA